MVINEMVSHGFIWSYGFMVTILNMTIICHNVYIMVTWFQYCNGSPSVAWYEFSAE